MIDIRAERKAQGLKLEYIAKKVGMSISYLSLLEKGERRISYSDYKSILSVLGYELKAQKKDVMEEIIMDKESVLMSNASNILSDDMNASSDKLIERLEEMDQDNSMLIQALKYARKYPVGDADTLLIKYLPVLCDYDKELLSVFNTNLTHAIKLGNKDPEAWSKEDVDWYKNWTKYDSELYNIGSKKRVEEFNVTEEENNYDEPLTIREYTLLNGTTISVIYWLNGSFVEYSFETNLRKKGIHTMEGTRTGLCHAFDDKEIIRHNELIFHLLSDKDRQDLVKMTLEIHAFERLFRAQLKAAIGLSTITTCLVSGILGVVRRPEIYTEEYREYIKECYINQ